MIAEKQCISKDCVHFRKNEKHNYWRRKEELKALKKAKKKGQATYEFEGKTYLVNKNI